MLGMVLCEAGHGFLRALGRALWRRGAGAEAFDAFAGHLASGLPADADSDARRLDVRAVISAAGNGSCRGTARKRLHGSQKGEGPRVRQSRDSLTGVTR